MHCNAKKHFLIFSSERELENKVSQLLQKMLLFISNKRLSTKVLCLHLCPQVIDTHQSRQGMQVIIEQPTK
ncbi:CLUMA_CG004982, isoform A [Clunio marinus]|uniref:CLUMA_CG004982, isoform A n=1 Tax=Clunio marinus TaxID=568069 RepID=A0A1J1HTI5_9DIPT|nr:CLUMA_CG004982, isoform A [Clunio marinus]